AQIRPDAAAHPVADDAVLRPVVAWVERAGAANDLLQFTRPGRMAFANLATQGIANVRGDVETLAECAVVEVADQTFLLVIAGPCQVDQCARVRSDDHADAARQAQTQGDIILRGGILDTADAGRHAVQPANDALLHGRCQPGNTAAGN